jgi:hypothetical protein
LCNLCFNEKRYSTLLELKSSEAIISLLREDIRNAFASHVTSSDLHTPAVTCETSGYDQTNRNWTLVRYNNNETKKMRASNTVNMESI